MACIERRYGAKVHPSPTGLQNRHAAVRIRRRPAGALQGVGEWFGVIAGLAGDVEGGKLEERVG